jgi:von Willebrand factor type A domain
MYFTKKMPALLSISLFAVQSAFGQSPPNCQHRTVIVSMIDARGIVPTDLTVDNFKVTYKGRATNPESVVHTKGRRRVLVLLDVSGSMRDTMTGTFDKWQIARGAAWELVAALPPGSKASLMTFSSKPEIVAAMSSDRTSIHDWLNGGVARSPEWLKGHTALYSAVESAVAQLQPTEPGDAIYLITDGGDNASTVREPKVENELRSSGVRLFALMLPPGGPFITEEERLGPEDLLRMSKGSGGFLEIAGTIYDDHMKSQIRLRAQQLSSQIADFYSITVQLPENPDKSQHLDLNVVDDRGHKRKDFVLAYPRKLSPCRVESVQR